MPFVGTMLTENRTGRLPRRSRGGIVPKKCSAKGPPGPVGIVERSQATTEWVDGMIQSIAESNGENFQELIREIDTIVPDEEIRTMSNVCYCQNLAEMGVAYNLSGCTLRRSVACIPK